MSDTPHEEAGPVRIVWPDDSLWPQGGYANAVLVNHTPWDFTLRLGHVVLPPMTPGTMPPSEGVEVIATPIAQVTLAPQALRQLAGVLQEQVARYTATYGAIEPLAGEMPPQDDGATS